MGSRTAPRRVVERVRIVLDSAAGISGNTLCEEIGVSRPAFTFRLNQSGGLKPITADRPRAGQPKRTGADLDAEIVRRNQQDAPPEGTHWATHLMATELMVSRLHVSRVWRVSSAGIREGDQSLEQEHGSRLSPVRLRDDGSEAIDPSIETGRHNSLKSESPPAL